MICMPVATAQSAGDVLRLSQYYTGGTARSVGMGGAFGALGGDLSVLSTNPAGLGVYRGSEFTFTPALNFNNTSALLDQTTFNEKAFRFNISNLGYVYTWNFYKSKGFQSLSLGLAYNRLSDFTSDAYVDVRAGNSQLDEFVWRANKGLYDPFYEGLAEATLAIWEDDEYGGEYINDYIYNGNRYNQQMVRSIGYRGGIGEYAISLGTNISNTLYLGFTWGIHDVNYEEFYTHEEFPHFREYLDSYYFDSNFQIYGWGMNAKLGLIYRPIQALRLGLAVHTPTGYWLTSEFATDMATYFTSPPAETGTATSYWEPSSVEVSDFRASTPWRYMASAAAVIGKIGLISLDAEYVNYSKNELLPNKDFKALNDDVSNIYQGALNLKAGTEILLGPIYLRGGFAYYGSPYKDDLAIFSDEVKNKPTFSYSGGAGFRTGSFYMDAAYSYTKYPKYYYDMYQPVEGEIVSSILQRINNKVVLTFGFKF